MNDFNEYVRESFSLAGDICDNEVFLKRTPTSDRLLADSELRYPYDGSKTLMHVFDRFEDTDLIAELLNGMHAELPEKKPKKTK
ncbi:MAG: competence protein TfoX [Saccharofermentans sp.]|nr:competence protein TfoX [Saccharofermentans sp.]